jgi:hypothetical protein
MSFIKDISSKIGSSFLGLILVIIFTIPGKYLEGVARKLSVILFNISSYFDFSGGGGYIDFFYEKYVAEAMATFVFSATMLLIPMYLNKKFFNKIKIIWLPSLILVFLFFSIFGIITTVAFVLNLTRLNWLGLLEFFLTLVAYFGSYLSVCYIALNYGDVSLPWLDKKKN